MHKNQDRTLNCVELTNEELSLAAGGSWPYWGYPHGWSNDDYVNQHSTQFQIALGNAQSLQSQVSNQNARNY